MEAELEIDRAAGTAGVSPKQVDTVSLAHRIAPDRQIGPRRIENDLV
jgi:hypothetical protein